LFLVGLRISAGMSSGFLVSSTSQVFILTTSLCSSCLAFLRNVSNYGSILYPHLVLV
jgi:hypothetical protein